MRNSIFPLTTFITCLMVKLIAAQPGIWSNSINVSNNLRTSRQPDICVDNQSQIHLVWNDNVLSAWGYTYAIYYKCFDGNTWASPAVQISDTGITDPLEPEIALDDQNRLHVVWYDNYYYASGYYAAIKYSRKQNGVWSPPVSLSLNAHYNWRPNILFDSAGRIYVFWDGSYNGYHHILYRIFDDNQWGPILDATPNADLAWDSKVRIDAQDYLHLVFVQGEGYSTQIFYTYNEGTGWSQPSLVTVAAGDQPDLCLDGNGDPNTVWRQDVPYVGYEIFYSKINAGVWTPSVNISQLGGHCGLPCLSIFSGIKYVSYYHCPTGINSILAFIQSPDSIWSAADTIFYGLPNMILESTLDIDTVGHLQLISTVPQSGVNSDIYHVAYINSILLLTYLTPHSPPSPSPPQAAAFNSMRPCQIWQCFPLV